MHTHYKCIFAFTVDLSKDLISNTARGTLGEYRGCDHDFKVESNSTQIEGNPDMEPLDPFLSRLSPEITWTGLEPTDSNIVLLVDAGFGLLKYLIADYPREPRVLREYETIDNFRMGQPTPLVVLVFRASPLSLNSLLSSQINGEKAFDLTEFMIEHHLEDDLIGLNWAVIGSDAYAMERQRLKGSVDNCHSLIQKKLQQEKPFDFTENFPLFEMDSSISMSFKQPKANFEVCCRHVEVPSKEIFVDSLANAELPTQAVRNLPTITSLRSIEYETENYQRSLRHYVALKEDKYTLVMFDPDRNYLFWLLTDIPAGALAAGTLITESNQVAEYIPPVPVESDPCLHAVVMLFKQPGPQHTSEISRFYNKDHGLRSRHCLGHCIHRSGFDIAQFKSFHRLKMSAVSWFKVCYDLHEAIRRIRQLKIANDSLVELVPHAKSSWQTQRQRTKNSRLRKVDLVSNQESFKQKIRAVCAAVQQEDLKFCDPEPSLAYKAHTRSFIVLTSILSYRIFGLL
ncbi:hypothetical protein M3Y97_00903700 [Aphelenchoides bicaudatus]|nr:hypothetical protein M3Y97_00903700 [Aphelenchoides bicaudatus]